MFYFYEMKESFQADIQKLWALWNCKQLCDYPVLLREAFCMPILHIATT